MAPTTRWRIPPESWCGYSRTRRSGAAMFTDARSSRARVQAPRLDTSSWARSVSAIWSPTVKSGLSEAMGSWRIIAMRLPRMARISASDLSRRFSPSKPMDPATIRAAGGRSRMSVSASVVLPEPDSPTMPRVFPASSVKETSSTARVTRVPRALTY